VHGPVEQPQWHAVAVAATCHLCDGAQTEVQADPGGVIFKSCGVSLHMEVRWVVLCHSQETERNTASWDLSGSFQIYGNKCFRRAQHLLVDLDELC